MASRAAAELKKDPNVEVQVVKGGIGEFAVVVDGQKVHDSWRWGYPNFGNIMKKIRAAISTPPR
jgi:hypothetical protein